MPSSPTHSPAPEADALRPDLAATSAAAEVTRRKIGVKDALALLCLDARRATDSRLFVTLDGVPGNSNDTGAQRFERIRMLRDTELDTALTNLRAIVDNTHLDARTRLELVIDL